MEEAKGDKVIPVSPDYGNIVQRYGFIPSHPSLVTILTSIFLHAGIIHLAGNMWYLWLFGDNVESRFGSFSAIPSSPHLEGLVFLEYNFHKQL